MSRLLFRAGPIEEAIGDELSEKRVAAVVDRLGRSADFPVRSNVRLEQGDRTFRNYRTFASCCGLESPRSGQHLHHAVEPALKRFFVVKVAIASGMQPLRTERFEP